MKNRKLKISGKFFLYSLGLLLILLLVCFLFFYNQLKAAVAVTQRQQVENLFSSLTDTLQQEIDKDKIIEITKQFSKENKSLNFAYISNDGEILFKSSNFNINAIPPISADSPFEKNGIKTRFTENATNNLEEIDVLPFILTLRVVDSGRIVISNPLHAREIIRSMIPTISKMFISILIICLFASLLFSKIITSPIKRIANDTKKMALLEDVTIPFKREDELGELYKDIYSMHLRLKTTIEDLQNEVVAVKKMEENQRYFFSAVSHELKTPIASSMSLLEGILDDVIKTEDYTQNIQNLLTIQQNQATLVNELLMIVNMNTPDFVIQKESIHLASLFDMILEDYDILLTEQRLSSEIFIDNSLFIRADKKLLLKIFNNLLLNAIQNTNANEKIQIFSIVEKDLIKLQIINTGTTISDEILKNIANPFFSTDVVRTSGIGKSGLGLTIVKKALDIQGFDFKIENINNDVGITIIF